MDVWGGEGSSAGISSQRVNPTISAALESIPGLGEVPRNSRNLERFGKGSTFPLGIDWKIPECP